MRGGGSKVSLSALCVILRNSAAKSIGEFLTVYTPFVSLSADIFSTGDNLGKLGITEYQKGGRMIRSPYIYIVLVIQLFVVFLAMMIVWNT